MQDGAEGQRQAGKRDAGFHRLDRSRTHSGSAARMPAVSPARVASIGVVTGERRRSPHSAPVRPESPDAAVSAPTRRSRNPQCRPAERRHDDAAAVDLEAKRAFCGKTLTVSGARSNKRRLPQATGFRRRKSPPDGNVCGVPCFPAVRHDASRSVPLPNCQTAAPSMVCIFAERP